MSYKIRSDRLRLCPSILLSVVSGYFLGIVSLVFPKFWQVARKLYEVLCDRGRFYGKYLLPKNWESGPKMGQSRVFHEFIEKSGPLIFTELFYNENMYYLLCFCANPKMFSAN